MRGHELRCARVLITCERLFQLHSTEFWQGDLEEVLTRTNRRPVDFDEDPPLPGMLLTLLIIS